MSFVTMAVSLPQIWNKAWPILLAILFFGLIIMIHEFGHFICAKWMKVQVNEFAIGMGPTLFKKKGKETTYALRALPVGGFVSMEGEDAESESDRSFNKKPIWRRMIIVVAGAMMNLILGFLLVACLVGNQNLVGTTTVAKFDPDAVSSQYGLKTGDEIKSINGMKVWSTNDISLGLTRDEDGVVDMVVRRNGKNVSLDGVRFATEEYSGHNMIKLDFFILGKPKNVGNVLQQAAKETVSYSRMIFLSLYDMLTGKYGLSDLSGPVGTIQIVAKATSTSLNSALNIMAFITINVGLFNLLPFPALDGGKFFLLLIEAITRRKIPSKYEWIINAVGFILLIGLMVVVTFSDISKIIKG